jgi:TPR repeat protein
MCTNRIVQKAINMNRTFIILLTLMLTTFNAQASFEEGFKAYLNSNYSVALTEFKADAYKGHAASQFWLGQMYELGQGVNQNYSIAFKWYYKAANQGYATSQFSLGQMYDLGRGVNQNSSEALKWYLEAAKSGDNIAQYKLGLMYKNGKGVMQNNKKALKWFGWACRNGLTESCEIYKKLRTKQASS